MRSIYYLVIGAFFILSTEVHADKKAIISSNDVKVGKKEGLGDVHEKVRIRIGSMMAGEKAMMFVQEMLELAQQGKTSKDVHLRVKGKVDELARNEESKRFIMMMISFVVEEVLKNRENITPQAAELLTKKMKR